jgi:hypothetical protein
LKQPGTLKPGKTKTGMNLLKKCINIQVSYFVKKKMAQIASMHKKLDEWLNCIPVYSLHFTVSLTKIYKKNDQ